MFLTPITPSCRTCRSGSITGVTCTTAPPRNSRCGQHCRADTCSQMLPNRRTCWIACGTSPGNTRPVHGEIRQMVHPQVDMLECCTCSTIQPHLVAAFQGRAAVHAEPDRELLC